MLYLQPQFRTNSGEVLNVMSSKGNMMGYILYLYKEDKDLYVVGHLDDIGEKQNYVDVIDHFVSGLKDACGVKEDPYIRIYCGGEPLDLEKEGEEKSS